MSLSGSEKSMAIIQILCTVCERRSDSHLNWVV